MVKFMCMQIGILESQRVTAPSKTIYTFRREKYLEVKDKNDIEFFRREGNKHIFWEWKPLKKAPIPKDTVKVKTEAKDPITEKKVKKIEESFTEKGLFKLVKAQQKYLIKKIGGRLAKVPTQEMYRVKKLLKLQSKGHNLIELLKGYKEE